MQVGGDWPGNGGTPHWRASASGTYKITVLNAQARSLIASADVEWYRAASAGLVARGSSSEVSGGEEACCRHIPCISDQNAVVDRFKLVRTSS